MKRIFANNNMQLQSFPYKNNFNKNLETLNKLNQRKELI